MKKPMTGHSLEDHGVYCRKIRNKSGEVTRIKYEPRLKRDGQSLSLGQYKTRAEAKIVHEIATFFYGHNQFGRFDFEDGSYSSVELGPNDDPSRYFVISPRLTENKEGKEKAKLVSRRAKEVYKQFKKEQAEFKENQAKGGDWIASIWMDENEDERPRTDVDVENVGVHLNGHSEARPFDLTNTQLQQPSHIDDVGNSAMGDIMLDNCGGTRHSASHAADTSKPTNLFDVTNACLPCPERHGMLESSMEVVLPLQGSDSQMAGHPRSHIFNYGAEPRPSTAPGPFPNSASASGTNFNSGNQVETFCLQVVSTMQQEKQWVQQQLVNTLQQENRELKQDKQELKQDKLELKRKVAELEAQLLDKQTQLDLQREFREDILCCSGEKRTRKKG